ncbi:MAG: SecA domain protein [Caproiciproducens sp.]|nr:SecA domain protein [Caproiciproducens sp.]
MKNLKKRLHVNGQSDLPYLEFVSRINNIDYQGDSLDQLRNTSRSFRGSQLQDNDFIVAFALLKEIIFRQTGLKLFDTQLSTAISLLKGKIAELPTGEGKTLAAVLPAAFHAMRGHSVHVLIFNDYLAKRDYLFTKPLYEFCGLSVGLIQQPMLVKERKIMYGRDIVYLSAKEAGFDYLKNFLCLQEEDLLCTEFDCAIVDEADSILIDEAKIPLVIAGNAPEELCSMSDISHAVKSLLPDEVVINKAANQVYLTDAGISRIETKLNIQNLYDEANLNILSMVNASLQAQFLLVRDKNYLVKENSIQIIDEFTGRVSENRRYPDILHSAVEVKENLNGSAGSVIYNSMPLQSFLLKYKKLCGMTGTIQTSAKEIQNMYGLDVDVIPPHKPCVRIDHEDVLYYTNADKYTAVVEEVKLAKGQPVLIGTQSVQESEKLSDLLTGEGILHYVLNAKNDEREAELIARAGEPERVTVSTNMAGRGVDIKLGGANEAKKAEVQTAGGLYVIGTGINSSIRIDNQLRGRAGRQGDAGESKFFISLEDALMVQYGIGQNISGSNRIDSVVTDRHVKKAVRRVQKYAEGSDAEARYMLEKYAYIQEEQRKVIADIRSAVLLDQKPFELLLEREPAYYKKLIDSAGKSGVEKAERQLTLYFINFHWAQYLESMEYIRDGIHFMLIAGKNPIDEYHRTAIAAFDEMMEDIKEDIVSSMKKYKITADGIDMKASGLSGATTTWTYLIDESSSQFSRIPYLAKTISNQIKGTVFTVSGLLRRLKKH